MSEAEASQRYAVVTGANKGIGLEAVKQLAFNGITVILTARDAKRGLEAVEKLKEFELSGRVLFHQLDVTDPASVASLADFITTQFGKLDILVNNAAISGLILDPEELARAVEHAGGWPLKAKYWDKLSVQTYELVEECLQINYYGAKRMVEAFLPLLQLSHSPRILNVSSILGSLENIPNELAKQILNDVEKLTEERVDEVLSEFMKDFKEGRLEAKGWPTNVSAYKLSKASMNAYTRILAKRFPNFRVNSIHPGYVKTDMTCNTGLLTVEEGAQILVTAALLPPDDKSSGLFISHEGVLSF
ncbi:(+)-neomenthol dehydrogenase-like isoform X1 [Ziziphus jujuba]|uniref:Short-chain dehydrogenase/reductase n=1 Tax=Ziziphus jujuba TaxID=326968 RepID=A0ABM3IR66_ZIZJJ|nr:(+)-neomenthol dehydrogenase-like isoform X1 [Ziziphus jujuba]